MDRRPRAGGFSLCFSIDGLSGCAVSLQRLLHHRCKKIAKGRARPPHFVNLLRPGRDI
jgi:hypothetical protein